MNGFIRAIVEQLPKSLIHLLVVDKFVHDEGLFVNLNRRSGKVQ